MFGSGFFGKGYFGGGFFGTPDSGGTPWGAPQKSTIMDGLPKEVLVKLEEKKALITKFEQIRTPFKPYEKSIDTKISEGLMSEKMAVPPVIEPDIALLMAIVEAMEA